MKSNWDLFKTRTQSNVAKKPVPPTQYQRKIAEEYRQRQEELKQRQQQRKQEKIKSTTKPEFKLFNFQQSQPQQQKSDRFQPIIVSYLTVQLQSKNDAKLQEEHTVYVQMYNSQSKEVLYESHINFDQEYFKLSDSHQNIQKIQFQDIIGGKTITTVRQEIRQLVNDEQFYCGYRVKYLFGQLKQNVKSSQILDLQQCVSLCDQYGNCNSIVELLINSGVGFQQKLNPQNLYDQIIQIYEKVKYKYDFEVAQYYKIHGKDQI